MPANLPPKAKALMREYQEARTLPEKIRILEALISAIPEHKGTEKIRRQLRRRLAQLKLELEERKRKRVKAASGKFAIKKDGAGQVVILGDTKSGKSSLLATLTNAKPKISDSPCTTRMPIPGMMIYEDVQVQLVEAPAIFPEAPWLSQVLSLARNADALILLVDLTRNPLHQLKFMVESLKEARIVLKKPKVRIEIERKSAGGIQIFCTGNFIDCSMDDVKRLLADYGINSAIVKIWGDVSIKEIEEYVGLNVVYKPSLIIANKYDSEIAKSNFEKLSSALKGVVKVIPFSTVDRRNLDIVKREIFNLLGVIRVYTKEVGGEVARRPLVVPAGTRVIDVAKIIHSRLYKEFKYAKVWGSSVKFAGQRVGANHVLSDGDIVEIRTL
ncbi:MAG: GTP-binding protein [Candidatus Methanomethylicota archaeon]|uniref:GTP-binding protein n=1 Tax=Thermoproteota archaeon TaxID=2056631 RepID=A0A497F2N3_9CREN|nr:MAG: GTP-binding protein [Candidatus Verstraetearchaeota archaeon]